MLYHAIRLGSEIFHEREPLGDFYDRYMRSKDHNRWQNIEQLTELDAATLIRFVNQWRTHYQSTPAQLLSAFRQTSGLVTALGGMDFLETDLATPMLPSGATVADLVAVIFNTLASCGIRFESTGTSKILHTVNPQFFVMWDDRIRSSYGIVNPDGAAYALFLARIQRLSQGAIREFIAAEGISRDEAISGLRQCPPHTLTKVLDEYNYAKFTLGASEIWNSELMDQFDS
jgi:hypothetical protein